MDNLILILIGILLMTLIAVFRMARGYKSVIHAQVNEDQIRELILTAAYWEKKALEAYTATEIMKYQKRATAANQKALDLSGDFKPPESIEEIKTAKVVNLNDYK